MQCVICEPLRLVWPLRSGRRNPVATPNMRPRASRLWLWAFLLPNASNQRLATLDFPSAPILSRVRCIALFGIGRSQAALRPDFFIARPSPHRPPYHGMDDIGAGVAFILFQRSEFA